MTPDPRSTQRIGGSTRMLGVIGWPVAHTRSPAMQSAAAAAAGVDAAYVPLPVHPDLVGDAVRGLRALGFAGVNVTIPHKPAVIPFLDELSDEARGIGAVNSIVVREDGRLCGHNTDAPAVYSILRRRFGFDPAGRTVLVLGAGGAARASAWKAAHLGAACVVIANRTLEKGETLAADIRRQFPATEVLALSPSSLAGHAPPPDAVLQMTSLGMKPDDPLPIAPALLPPGAIALDGVYAPVNTAFLGAARERGLQAADGLEMLVEQGALAFELWTGSPADRNAMRAALAMDP